MAGRSLESSKRWHPSGFCYFPCYSIFVFKTAGIARLTTKGGTANSGPGSAKSQVGGIGGHPEGADATVAHQI